MTLFKKDFFWISLWIPVLFLFYPGLFFAKEAALIADHLEQHFPWFAFLFESIRRGELPLWTHDIHCGFPLAAEGQIATFYPPNILLCLLLPLKTAYSYSSLVHFFISAVGTYVYARRYGQTHAAAFISAFIFLFGSAFGGAYYNITSLKTICWFPWLLYFFDSYSQTGKRRYVLATGAALGLCLIAGYLQVAILTIGMYFIYVALHQWLLKPQRHDHFSWWYWVAGVGLGFLTAAPQTLLSFQLALLSNRIDMAEPYAYVGSLSPLAVMTLIFTEFQGLLRGNSLYSGIISLFFVLCSLSRLSKKEDLWLKLWVAFGLVALLLALGQWSPLYVALIKLTKFYSFRIPSKFLVFVCFSLALLSGYGFQKLAGQDLLERIAVKRAKKAFLTMTALLSLIYFSTLALILWHRELVFKAGDYFIHKFIFNKAGHPHSINVYHQKLNGLMDSIIPLLTWQNPWVKISFIIVNLSLFLILVGEKLFGKKKWLLFLMSVLFLDLYCFTFRDIKLDFASYQSIEKTNPIVDALIGEQRKGLLGRLYGFHLPEERLPIRPSMNMLYDISDIGLYSPFVLRKYYETIGQFGNVDDSNTAAIPDEQFVNDHMPLLKFIGVSHILSSQKLLLPDALEIAVHEPFYLYRLSNPLPGSYVVYQSKSMSTWNELKEELLRPQFDPSQLILLESKSEAPLISRPAFSSKITKLLQKNHVLQWEVQIDGPGYFVCTNSFYPGWTASVNGKKRNIQPAYGIFQSVTLETAGTYNITFEYSSLQALKELFSLWIS